LVERVFSTPVASFRTVTLALASAAPWGSVTTPLMTALSERWARSGLLKQRLKARAVSAGRASRWDLVISTSLREWSRARKKLAL
jgi:hypothetical protein